MRTIIYIAGLFVSIIANAQNRVAVIDTGIVVNDKNRFYLCESGHQDFTGFGLYDDEGHGTTVVDYIIDNAKTKNFCIVVLKFYQRNLSNKAVVSATIQALKQVNKLNIRLVNYSASGAFRSLEEETTVRSMLSTTIVVAAGNDGVNLDDSPRFPASYGYSNVVVVGALTEEGKRQKISNYGTVVTEWEKAKATSYATAIKTGKLIHERFAK